MDATTFAALGEPRRLQIVEALRDRPFAVGDLAVALDMQQPATSKHLQVLRDVGLVDVTPEGRRRIHHLRPQPFDELDRWVASFERVWTSRLDALGAYLAGEQEPPR